jgi:hypothetical protein
LLRDGDGFRFVRDLEMEIASNGLLRLSERTIGHDATLPAGDKLALVLQWMTVCTSFLCESLEPSGPVGHDLLKLFGPKLLDSIGAAE